jgi:hypothetical protein
VVNRPETGYLHMKELKMPIIELSNVRKTYPLARSTWKP